METLVNEIDISIEASTKKPNKFNAFTQYIKAVWEARYFWWHLAMSDLRNRYRRSYLGILWAALNPILLTCVLVFIVGSIFHLNQANYGVYVFSGLIIWDYVVLSGVTSCGSFLCSDTYIKQYKNPLIIYSLRSVLVSSINFLLPFMILILWQVVLHFYVINFSILSLVFAMPIFFLIAWPLATITSFITTKFRDFMQIITVFFQVLWYASPVFLRPEMFINANRGYLLDYNPIYHVMNLIRMPLMEGRLPHVVDYLSALLLALVLWLIAIRMIVKQERKIIFYL